MFRDSVLDGSVDFSVLTTSFQVQRLAARLQLVLFGFACTNLLDAGLWVCIAIGHFLAFDFAVFVIGAFPAPALACGVGRAQFFQDFLCQYKCRSRKISSPSRTRSFCIPSRHHWMWCLVG